MYLSSVLHINSLVFEIHGYFYGNEVPRKLLHPIQCVSDAGVKFCEERVCC